jgi:hypothetical protein
MSKISVVTLSILGKNISVFRLENFFSKGEHYNEIPPMPDSNVRTTINILGVFTLTAEFNFRTSQISSRAFR